MIDRKIGVVIPMRGQFAYTRRAVLSLFKYSPTAHAIVVDDASPNFNQMDWAGLQTETDGHSLHIHSFPLSDGLTRSWNYGLELCRELGLYYAVAGNNDVLFSPGWEDGLIAAIDTVGYSLVGPVTNAPGTTNPKDQYVGKYLKTYQLSDEPEEIEKTAKYLQETYPFEVVLGGINGFFMFGLVEDWFRFSYSHDFVFNPGKRLTGNEDEYQKRVRARDGKTGIVPSSFIFHYRAVTRGDRFKAGQWHRCKDPFKPV